MARTVFFATLLVCFAAQADAADSAPAAFTLCAGCHEVTENAAAAPGPNLFALAGRTAGRGDFAYSQAMRRSGIVWNRATLIAFIENAQAVVPGTSMIAPPVRDRRDAEAIADFLGLHASEGEPEIAPAASSPIEKPTLPDVVESEQATFRIVTVADELAHPWSLAFLPKGEMLVTEKRGTVVRIDAAGNKTSLQGVPDDVYFGGNQAGMHGIVVHPQFESNQLVYIAYIAGTEHENRLRLVRYRLRDAALTESRTLFESLPRRVKAHSGGRLMFTADGKLLLGVGTVFGADADAQTLTDTFGTIIRLNDDGSVPADNPFVNRVDAQPLIYTFGNRNPQGFALRPGTGQIWSTEHGPMGGDEINLLVGGANYGWPLASFGRNYDGSRVSPNRRLPGTEAPRWYWVPSIGPGGITFYDGNAFPNWRGDLFVAAMRAMRLERFELHGDQVIGRELLLETIAERVRDVRSGPDGFLYIVLDNDPGRIIRLEPAK